MQALVELIAGFVALLAAAALSQFGVDIQSPRSGDREVHRVCPDASTPATIAATRSKDC